MVQSLLLGEGYINEHFTTGKNLLHVLQTAWNAESIYSINPNEGGLGHLYGRVHGQNKESGSITAFGSLGSLVDLAQVFAWFCCALRPFPSEGIRLSTFNFDIAVGRNQLPYGR